MTDRQKDYLGLGLGIGGAIVGYGIIIGYFSKHGGAAKGAECLGITLIPLAGIAVFAFIIGGIERLATTNSERRISNSWEGWVFDLWSIFHYLVPALIGTGLSLWMVEGKITSGAAILIAAAAITTICVATLWELVERPIGWGQGEYPLNIAIDVVLGALGASAGSYAFLVSRGFEASLPLSAVVGLICAVVGFSATSLMLRYGWIKPVVGKDTWPCKG